MKIVFIISSLGSGGAERVVTNLANYFVSKYEVIILTLSDEDSFYPLNKNVKHIKLNLMKNSRNIFETIFNTFKRIIVLKKTLKKLNADINISFMTYTNILAILSSRLNGQKIIISEDIEYNFYNDKKLFFIRRIVYKFSNLLVVKTHSDKKNYNFLSNIEVVGNPLPMEFTEVDLLNKKKDIILAVGRLDKQKGFDNLIKAYSILNTDWKLFIAGEGKERENLENLINELNLEDKVFLIGNQKNIIEWYKKASIFVLSSRKEGFGNVLIEAMACGCAVVSFDCPYGPNEIIKNNINGILVENQNIKKLAFSIQKLINDRNLRENLAKEALKVREKYSLDKIADKWEKIIKRVIDE